MMEPDAAVNLDLADLGDFVERLTKIARANGVATMSMTAGSISVDLSLVVSPAPIDHAVTRAPETAIVLPSPPTVVAADYIPAPMVGTFYTGSKPGEPAFVEPGDRVEVGQTIGIIEAMKIMNEIPSEVAGLVLEVLVTNGQAVEYGTPLFRITPDLGQ